MKLQYHYALSGDSYDVRHTSGAIAKNLNFHVDSLGHYHTYPGYYTDREGLDTYLLLFTLSGQGYLEYQGQEYFMTKDTAQSLRNGNSNISIFMAALPISTMRCCEAREQYFWIFRIPSG